MDAPTEVEWVHRARVEQAAMDSLAARLVVQFPEFTADEIAATIRVQYEGYESSPIRDFIPVLVERAARADLAHQHGHRA